MNQRKLIPNASGDDDVEGHAFRGKATEDDVEGHSFLSNPLLNRELASGREQEIRRNLKQRQNSAEAQRPHNKRGRS